MLYYFVFIAVYSSLSINGLLYGSSSFFLFPCFSVFFYGGKVSATSFGKVIIFPPLSGGGIILGMQFPFTFLNLSHTLVGVLGFNEFINLFHVSFLAFLKTLYLMSPLCWNDLSLVVFVGSRQSFL